MAMYRLVAADLDGTLLGPNGQVSARTRAIVTEVVKAGVILALATSRRFTGASPVAEFLGLRGPLILYDGAQTRAFPSADIVAEHPLAVATARSAATILHEHGLRPIAQYGDASGERLRVAEAAPDGSHDLDYLANFTSQITMLPLAQLCSDDAGPLRLVAFGAWSQLLAAASAIESLDCGVQLLRLGNYGTSELTVFAPAASKGNALAQLAARLDISLKETFAIGDGVNDVSMLRVAGLGVAMAHADPTVRAAARAVAGEGEDAAAEAIAQHVLG